MPFVYPDLTPIQTRPILTKTLREKNQCVYQYHHDKIIACMYVYDKIKFEDIYSVGL